MQEQDIYGVLFSIGKNHGNFSATIAKHLAKEVFLHCLLPVYLHVNGLCKMIVFTFSKKRAWYYKFIFVFFYEVGRIVEGLELMSVKFIPFCRIDSLCLYSYLKVQYLKKLTTLVH